MATTTTRQLRDWAENDVALWNAGDRAGWVRNWRNVAPGELRMLDPVGTPGKPGYEACALEPWELFQRQVEYRVVAGSLVICANEVAWFLENRISTDGRSVVGHSIETYRFEPNGDLGRIFPTPLPEPGQST